MIVLVVNGGSTSLKVDIFAMPEEECLASAAVQRIGRSNSAIKIGGASITSSEESRPVANHEQALDIVLDALIQHFEVDAIGHRIVHGGEELTEPTAIDDRVCRIVEDCARFAPLHNPANLAGVRAARSRLPKCPQVAVTDTGFHRTLEPAAFLYGIPYDLYQTHGVRRFGFHGTSHQFVASGAANHLGRPLSDLNLITCHLGGGASVCAIAGGRSVDTSMGMTPLEGLVMGTRCGDIDAGVVLYLQEQLSMSSAQIDQMLNRESGLLGVSGISRDMRDIIAAADRGESRARLAIDVFCRRVRHYIGAYLAQLGGANAIVFTGGIGENSSQIRAEIAGQLSALGIELDDRANQSGDRNTRTVSTPGSPIAVLVVPTDEELQIAREVHQVIT